MQWFTGSIPEAIGESRRGRLAFIVYIEGDNEDTRKMNAVWEDHKVEETLSKDKCIAIKLDSKSEDCKQFSKLYPVVCIPATYFIGEAGLPLEVIGGSLPVDEFISKASKALEAHQKSHVNNTTEQSAANSLEQSCENPEAAQQTSNAGHHQEPSNSVVNRQAVSTEPSPQTSKVQEMEASSSSQQQASLSERVERAKQLIEQRREDKVVHETKEVKKSELSRRHLGQELSKAKRDREERQAQDIVNQIKEDRAKERAHREAVRQQIARDRAEREARRQNEIQERQRAPEAAPSAAVSGASDTRAARDCTSTRLQFRLPDGSSVTKSFSADVLLEAVRQFIVNHLGPNYTSVTMYTTYPRRELTDEDLLRSLAELGLAPSSTLVVAVKGRNALAPSTSWSFSELLVWILSPLFALINFLKLLLFGNPNQPRGSYNPGQTRSTATQESHQSNSAVRRRIPGNSTFVKEEGGVHRLKNNDDEDDENNTWNGNSTQQM